MKTFWLITLTVEFLLIVWTAVRSNRMDNNPAKYNGEKRLDAMLQFVLALGGSVMFDACGLIYQLVRHWLR